MTDLYTTAQEFKGRLLKGDRAAAGDILRAYGLAVRRISARIKQLTDQIQAARLQGEEISSGWLYERDRLTNLKREIIVELQRFSRVASLRVAREQSAARELGADAAQALIGESDGAPVAIRLGTFGSRASSALAGFAADGSPLRELFIERGLEVARRVSDELVAGVAEGQPARVIAARMRIAFGGDLARSLTIARTETVRAYREASRETYVANAAVLRGWYWQAALDARTCVVCIAMHGTVFPVSARLESHVNCRCVPVPLTTAAPLPETGPEWFARQEPGLQRQVLGAAKFEAFREGKFELKDLVGVSHSERWGVSRYERPLSAILNEE
jgi:SPP1 gp7 family putative phage head morphogenesis protein